VIGESRAGEIMKALSIKHIGIYTKDFDVMVKFYKDTVGLIEIADYYDSGVHLDKILKRENAEARICKLVTPFGKQKGTGDMIELIGISANTGRHQDRELFTPGLSHIALETENIAGLYEAIIRGGGQGVCEPLVVSGSGNYMAFCTDPEGNYLELIQRRREQDKEKWGS